MAQSRRITSYPEWMLALAGEFEDSKGARRILSYPDAKQAARARQHLYGFRNALERAGMFPMYPHFQAIHLVIHGSDLHILHANDYYTKPTENEIATH